MSEPLEGLAEALKFTAQQAQAAQQKKIEIISLVDKVGEPDGTYAVVKPDGSYEIKTTGPDWIDLTLNTPENLLQYINNEKIPADPVVMVGTDKIVLALDEYDPRDTATVPLVEHEQFKLLRSLTGDKSFDQRGFIFLLRVLLRGCLPDESSLLALVRQLKFNVDSSGAGQIGHGNESLGKSLVARVAGVEAIPEEIRLTVPVFENWQWRVDVNCAIDILTQEQRFRLIPFPGEMVTARQTSLEAIEEMLASNENKVPVYQGSF